MHLGVKSAFLLGAAILIGSASAAVAQPTGLEDMVGARAGQAEAELGRRGYRNTGGQRGDDRTYAYWWNAARRQCVTIATMDGRYDSITPTPAPDCGQTAGGPPPRPPHDRPPHDRPPPPSSGVAVGDLSRFCRGEAAAAFDRRPSEITTVGHIAQADGYTVRGWFEQDRRTTFFTCRFDRDGRFIDVR